MSKRTAVVYFYMIGCPHCEAMRPAWENAKKQIKNVEISEKESATLSPDDGVQSFPTVILYKNGKEVKRIEGARKKGRDIVKELGLRSSRGRTYRGKRKTRNRTLRNYKALA
jgi:thiol-disulfide isomerase/thioredoxin